jgi:hypothetical protein
MGLIHHDDAEHPAVREAREATRLPRSRWYLLLAVLVCIAVTLPACGGHATLRSPWKTGAPSAQVLASCPNPAAMPGVALPTLYRWCRDALVAQQPPGATSPAACPPLDRVAPEPIATAYHACRELALKEHP